MMDVKKDGVKLTKEWLRLDTITPFSAGVALAAGDIIDVRASHNNASAKTITPIFMNLNIFKITA